MLPMPWCRRAKTNPPRTFGLAGTTKPWLYANQSYLDIMLKRGKELRYGMTTFNETTKVDEFLQDLKTEKPLFTTLGTAREPPLRRSESINSAILKPLEECILATLWGLLDCTSTQETLQPWTSLHDGTLADFIVLLNEAAEYQATIGTVSQWSIMNSSIANKLPEPIDCLYTHMSPQLYRSTSGQGIKPRKLRSSLPSIMRAILLQSRMHPTNRAPTRTISRRALARNLPQRKPAQQNLVALCLLQLLYPRRHTESSSPALFQKS
jgi:hypothetical protein